MALIKNQNQSNKNGLSISDNGKLFLLRVRINTEVYLSKRSENMSKQVYNPFLPCSEYVPDPEARVFGDRIYIYGSHDIYGGNDYCEGDYVGWSAPVNDLSDWRYEGVIYRKEQHPYQIGTGNLFAPDVIQGPDGRYYLYYSIADSSIISIAVCDTPVGEYQYYSDLKDQTGRTIGTDLSDYFEFDPSVFIDDDGQIYLYSGSSQSSHEKLGHPVVGLFVRKLAEDMKTVISEPKILMHAEETREKPNFFEAASLRKIDSLYYLIYFATDISGLNYCTSQYPDRDFQYRGIIHSTCDIGLNGRTLRNAVNQIGNNHGSIACIGDQYYIFNHRNTNRSYYQRQTIAEPITIHDDGYIPQVESTSCGLNGGPFTEKGRYPAYIACNIMNVRVDGIRNPRTAPYITQEEQDGEYVQYIKEFKNGCLLGFKYFQVKGISSFDIQLRGKATGEMKIKLEEEGESVGSVAVDLNTSEWITISKEITLPEHKISLYLEFEGVGELEILNFTID